MPSSDPGGGGHDTPSWSSAADARPAPSPPGHAMSLGFGERAAWVLAAVADDLREGRAAPGVEVLDRAMALLAAIAPRGTRNARASTARADEERRRWPDAAD